ncbi:hypothetical protein FHR70_001494 [Microvirga lupini]|uniref:Uncharacterized protein n=1 Tax=Microvirga lupini TaxID=420324 RepID=A0A7W4YVJ3_9HYPH|nr:hypothetical protein [Microvirga lupini]MBB3018440.1 hypothetical protein [Microvirga lupini]
MCSYKPMKKTLIVLGASIVTHGMMFSGAEARLVRYEINGKQYSYSTNNRAQTAEARRRIEAAKAAEAAKAKAEAEKARNPLAAAFSSATQKEAKDAEQRLQQILSGPAEYMAVSQPVRGSDRKPQEKQPDLVAAKAPQKPITVVRAPARPILASAVTKSLVIAEPVAPERRTNVRSVSFDMQTGIKTTIMTNGDIEEEPFDSSALAFLTPKPEKGHSLMAFVNQLRKVAPEEATGSIQTTLADPEDASLIRHR